MIYLWLGLSFLHAQEHSAEPIEIITTRELTATEKAYNKAAVAIEAPDIIS